MENQNISNFFPFPKIVPLVR